MIGKILGAVAGERVAQHVTGVSGPAGALLGAGTVAVARRLSPLGLIAAAVGGYALKRYYDKNRNHTPAAPARKPTRKKTP